MLPFIETGFINIILSKINFISSKFLLSAICSLIFLQSKGGKRQTPWIENTKTFVSCFAIIFFHKNTVGECEIPSLLQKENRRSGKSDVSKVLFPDIGKITNRYYQGAGIGVKFWRQSIGRRSQISRRSSNQPLQLESVAARVLKLF